MPFSSFPTSYLQLPACLFLVFLTTCANPSGPPELAITAPSADALLEGVASVTVDASSAGELARLELLVDDAVSATITGSSLPRSFSWDTGSSASASTAPTRHVLKIRAYNGDGRKRESDPVAVYVLYPKRLTETPDIDIQPEWSSDGTKIIFKSNRFSPDPVQSFKIYTMTATGAAETQIFTDRDYHGYPDWSPDGQHVIFNSFDPGNNEIFTASVISGVSQRITNDPSFDDSGRWSPDGTRIAFFSTRTGNPELYLTPVTLSGAPNGSPVRLTSNAFRDEQPRWSPDGTKLVFESDRTGVMKVWTMPAVGGTAVQVTDDRTGDDGYPNWSRDGRRIVFDSERNGNRDLYIIAAEGGAPIRITSHTAFDEHPSWSPDGRKIVFASNRSGNMDIWVVEIPVLP
ncbi:MAG: PD40 domain-containing protein [candidate division Zixibacteria bacterium]|nr:PD40 domain-containing protein [candidate division Zixibacteria bacterium]